MEVEIIQERFEEVHSEGIWREFYKYSVKMKLKPKKVYILLEGKMSLSSVERWMKRLGITHK